MFKKSFSVLSIFMCLTHLVSAQDNIHKADNMKINIATFDSGFGGYFTAKSIETSAQKIVKNYNTTFTINHFGDTQNAPYGEKTPEKIAQMTTDGVLRALDDGAEMVFIACNTASTQYPAVKKAVAEKYAGREEDVISIIDASVQDVKDRLDKKLFTQNEVHFALLATPATIKSGVYPKNLAELYEGRLESSPLKAVEQTRWLQSKGKTIKSYTGHSSIHLDDGKIIHIYQLAPANWVELIEQEGTLADKNKAVTRDIKLLTDNLPKNVTLDGVGEFCTHYPVFDNLIQSRILAENKAQDDTFYIKQAPLMAEIFEKKMEKELSSVKRDIPLENNNSQLEKLYTMMRPKITISGDNVDATKRLARTVFPKDAEPEVVSEINKVAKTGTYSPQ